MLLIEDEIKWGQTLNEHDKNLLLGIIKETLSINADVINETNRIYDIFLEKIRYAEWKKLEGGMVSETIIEFNDKAFGGQEKVTFTFNCYNVFNVYSYGIFKSKYSFGNGGTNRTKNIIVNVGFLSGRLKDSPKPTLQHELEHLYQTIKIGGSLTINGFGKKNSEAYEWALKLLTTGNNLITNRKCTQEEYDVAFLVYTHADYEIDGFVNQLYQELKFSPDTTSKAIKKSSAYRYYLDGKENLKLIKSKPEVYKPIIEKLGIKYKDFVSLFTHLNNRYIHKIGKILIQYDDHLMENTMIDFFDLKPHLKDYETEN